MTCFEENEVSKNANGGTELTKRGIAALIPEEIQEHFQVIPSRVGEIKEDKIRIYWVHDLPEDPIVSHLKESKSRNRFHKIIFNCNHHLNDCHTKLQFPLDNKIDIIETAVEPIPYQPKVVDDKIHLIYLSTPQRGLELLVPVFEALAQRYSNIHLNVFSSFKIYGWEQMDEKFEPLYKRIRSHPQMTYHGYGNREEVTSWLQKSHILAYPCIWRETACRVLIEAMSAGLMCVHPNHGALADTAGQLTLAYQYQDNVSKHREIFASYLEHSINTVLGEQIQNYLGFVKTYADMRFNMKSIAKKWEQLMGQLISLHPDQKSRSVQIPMFIYKT